MLTVVEDGEEIGRLQQALVRRLEEASQGPESAWIGHRGGGSSATRYRLPQTSFWSAHKVVRTRHWNAFGLLDPDTEEPGPIVVEVNPPMDGLDRRTGGVFVADDTGAYLAHRGRVGGGRPGIGKEAFRSWYLGDWHRVQDGRAESEVIVVGSVTDPALPTQLAWFTRTVAAFKNEMTGQAATSLNGGGPRTASEHSYSPEFQGARDAYQVAPGGIMAVANHGCVVDTLHDHLLEAGIAAFNDQQRDLYVPGAAGEPDHVVFEVKTDTSTGSVYALVGQLLFHGGAGRARNLVGVLPAPIASDLRRRLEELGILVVAYGWDAGRVVLPELETHLHRFGG